MVSIVVEFLIGLLPKKPANIVISIFAIAVVLFILFWMTLFALAG